MAETVNIAEMASKISEEIFETFGWKKINPMDINWKCVTPSHQKSTHPTDVVFNYEHPYLNKSIYLNTDLKSHGATSISKKSIDTAMTSLCLATHCANLSKDWQHLFTNQTRPHQISSLLFIYNHDNENTKSTQTLLNFLETLSTSPTKDQKIYVLDSEKINLLSTISNDICRERGKGTLPQAGEHFWFFYPDLITQKARIIHSPSATIETLLGPIITIIYQIAAQDKIKTNTLLYYTGDGSDPYEFKYLIDYLFRYQLMSSDGEITIKTVKYTQELLSNFKQAKNLYAADTYNLPEIENRLDKIVLKSIPFIRPTFNEYEIGMER